ncbi:prephenate dehydrogenase [Faecalibaculum rodentium]|uniref:prephenate dehydrogenase n=1 Tax=Faecalibaculum rodentium TaxID=1702221 RepID=UPI0023F58159|nr:prephenate dehydrogenase [Faecalibaculum rodentium]
MTTPEQTPAAALHPKWAGSRCAFGIVGLGVMGGSFAARLRQLGYTVYGMDLDADTLQYAQDQGIIDAGSQDPAMLLPQCDVVIFCLYPTKIEPWLRDHQHHLNPGTLVLEISGVKTGITGPLQDLMRPDCELLSIHPMCGRESQGIRYSDPKIFDGANFLIIPTDRNTHESVRFVQGLARELGCGAISELDPESHDRMIGFLSQLTHVIAVSLMNTHENSHLVQYTGDSFRDLTRIARINENMWPELFLLNREILLDETDQFLAAVQQFRDMLANGDRQGMKEAMIESTKRREKFG